MTILMSRDGLAGIGVRRIRYATPREKTAA